jgi:hypothetical protein
MKAPCTVGRAVLVALMMTTLTLGGGVFTLALAPRPLTPLGRLVLRLVVAHDVLGVRVTWRYIQVEKR